MHISNMDAVTRYVTIRVNSIPDDISDDFSITIENDNNPTRIILVKPTYINRYSNTYEIKYVAANRFTLDSLNVTCKYPVKVYCEDFILGGCIVPDSHNKIISCTIMDLFGRSIEFEGTEEQIKAFEDKRKEINESLFPRAMELIDILSLALDYKLVLRKVTN